jgi:hypothetical protein
MKSVKEFKSERKKKHSKQDQRLFEFLKPFFVKHLKDKNTCCIYHVKLDELRLTLNLLKTKSVVHDKQRCECHCDNVCDFNGQQCQTSYVVY